MAVAGIDGSLFAVRASSKAHFLQLIPEFAACLPQAFVFRLKSKHTVVTSVL